MIPINPPPESPHSALQSALDDLAAGTPLGEIQVGAAVAEMVSGSAQAPLVAAFLMALREKGESDVDIAGAVRALKAAMLTVGHATPHLLVDTCGTGGGRVTTVNLSTAAAFVAAGAGVPIAKHGNRSYSSRSGSADVLEALGVSIDLDAAHASRVLADIGIAFLFAPNFHPAMRHVAPVRRELKVATLMNLVGPLANPAGAVRQVVGVGDPARAPMMAGALARLGATHALVVHATIGMDEFSPVGPTQIWEVHEGKVREWQFDPGKTSLSSHTLDGLEGGEPAENAAKLAALLERPSRAAPALRAAVLLNAAAAIYVSGRVGTMGAAIDAAVDALESGRAMEKLEALRASTPSR